MELKDGVVYDSLYCSLENNEDISVGICLKIFDDGFDVYIKPYKSWSGKFFEYGVLVSSIQACRYYIISFFDKLVDENHYAYTVVNGIKIVNVVPNLIEMCRDDGEFIKVN